MANGAGGYDVSASTARSTAQAANQYAGTVFNFSSPGSWFSADADQSATPSASATAANRSPGTTGGSIVPPSQPGKSPNQLPWIVAGVLGAVLLTRKR